MKKIISISFALQFSVITISAQMLCPVNPTQYPGISGGCTVITVAKEENVFFAGNDDFINPDSWYFVEQGDSSNYGVIWIGKPENPQQGISEKGLAYDANGLPRFEPGNIVERCFLFINQRNENQNSL